MKLYEEGYIFLRVAFTANERLEPPTRINIPTIINKFTIKKTKYAFLLISFLFLKNHRTLREHMRSLLLNCLEQVNPNFQTFDQLFEGTSS